MDIYNLHFAYKATTTYKFEVCHLEAIKILRITSSNMSSEGHPVRVYETLENEAWLTVTLMNDSYLDLFDSDHS